jgi:hypothetical protein
MRKSISKAVVVTLVATVMALCSTSPSSAFEGFHGGSGGFRPGFGGFHPGFRPFVGPRFFHPGFFRNGVFINAVVVGGWGGDGCWTYRPAYDAAGNYLGYICL